MNTSTVLSAAYEIFRRLFLMQFFIYKEDSVLIDFTPLFSNLSSDNQ